MNGHSEITGGPGRRGFSFERFFDHLPRRTSHTGRHVDNRVNQKPRRNWFAITTSRLDVTELMR